MANPKSRIEGELDGVAYTNKSRIEEYIAYIKGDSQTKPDKPRSRIEEQLDGISPGGGGGTLIERTITENDVYFATDDNADGYSKVTVNVPQPVVTTNRISADLNNYVEGDTSLGNGFNIKNNSTGSLESSTITIDETVYHGLKFNNAPGATIYTNRALGVDTPILEIEAVITELTTNGDCRLASTGGVYYNGSVWYSGGDTYTADQYLRIVVYQGAILDSNLVNIGEGNTYDSSFPKTNLVNSPLNIKYIFTSDGVILKINNVNKAIYPTSAFNSDVSTYGLNIGANGAQGSSMLLTKAEYSGEVMTWGGHTYIRSD